MLIKITYKLNLACFSGTREMLHSEKCCRKIVSKIIFCLPIGSHIKCCKNKCQFSSKRTFFQKKKKAKQSYKNTIIKSFIHNFPIGCIQQLQFITYKTIFDFHKKQEISLIKWSFVQILFRYMYIVKYIGLQ